MTADRSGQFAAADEDAVAVAVRDHGVGFRADEADMVFSRFWRADPARARTTGGTGLGLSIALEDARLHGGGLDAWGSPGEGAWFRLTLPRRPRATGTTRRRCPPARRTRRGRRWSASWSRWARRTSG